jgi:hypothetical protein
MDAAGWHQPGKSGGFDPVHRLSQQDQAVVKLMVVDRRIQSDNQIDRDENML